MEHHERAVAAYVERARTRPGCLAVIVDGSVARGSERIDSDVDLCLVVTDEAFEQAGREQRLSYVDRDGIDYPGGYYDIKVITLTYLEQAAERGDDPVRACFADARVVWTRVDDLAERLRRVAEPPAESWTPRVASFLSQMQLYGGYFLRQGAEHHNAFLLRHAAVHLVLACGRALLAHHRVLFAGPKYLTEQVAALPTRPAGFADAAAALLSDPTVAAAEHLMALMTGYTAWPWDAANALSTFVHDNELAWLHRTPPPEYS